MGVDVRFLGFILTQWGMQFFIVFQCFSLFLHLQWFGVIIDLLHFFPVWWASPSVFLWISMCICGALQSSTVYLCAGGQRWQCLGGRLHGKLPGWQCQRGLRWHLPDEIRCPGCPPVDVPARWWGQWRCSGPSGGRGATSFSNLFHGEKTWKNFRSSCEVHVLSQVECHHIWRVSSHSNGPICWVHLQGRYMSISRICWKFNRCLLTSLDQIRNKPG